jgi:predicted nucleotidyltransferase component of viral defense system
VSSAGRLTELQHRVLNALDGFEPPFVLTGGGALAAVHLRHRGTRDLDLFWRQHERLDELPRQIVERLAANGLSVSTLRTAPSYVELRVADDSTSVVVDLVADPTHVADPPTTHRIGNAEILVDSPREILANKLCTLLGRAEIRDLIDVEALLASGASLQTALSDAPAKDGGFSPLTLAWVLEGLDVRRMADAVGLDESERQRLETFRRSLIEQLITP